MRRDLGARASRPLNCGANQLKPCVKLKAFDCEVHAGETPALPGTGIDDE
jgi:hypothetical protein